MSPRYLDLEVQSFLEFSSLGPYHYRLPLHSTTARLRVSILPTLTAKEGFGKWKITLMGKVVSVWIHLNYKIKSGAMGAQFPFALAEDTGGFRCWVPAAFAEDKNSIARTHIRQFTTAVIPAPRGIPSNMYTHPQTDRHTHTITLIKIRACFSTNRTG